MTVSETSLVGRLREKRGILDNRWPGPTQLELEAAETIERLTRELEAANSNHRAMATQLAEAGERALTAEAQRDGAYEAIDKFFVGWDSLPIGNHSVLTISRWLNSKSMVDGVLAIRAARQKPDQ